MKQSHLRACAIAGWLAVALSLQAQGLNRYFTGAVKDHAGKPQTGLIGLAFSLYEEREGGSPVWTEMQNVQLDEQGRYMVTLNFMQHGGLPPDLAGARKAPWLGVQGPDGFEPPRVLVSGAMPAATGVPVIDYFSVAPASTLPGQAAIGTVLVSGATSATLNGVIASCSLGVCGGTFLFYPTATTTYVLQATGAGGNVSASQQVEVGKYQPNPPPSPVGLQVTWQKACWLKNYPKSFCNGACQGMSFSVNVPTPPAQLPLEATLYLGSTTCNPSSQDNLNDLGTPTGSGGWIFWFTHHPNMKNSSAIWTIGNQSSGCVSYAKAPVCP